MFFYPFVPSRTTLLPILRMPGKMEQTASSTLFTHHATVREQDRPNLAKAINGYRVSAP